MRTANAVGEVAERFFHMPRRHIGVSGGTLDDQIRADAKLLRCFGQRYERWIALSSPAPPQLREPRVVCPFRHSWPAALLRKEIQQRRT